MNKLEIFQEVFGKDYVFTENELSRLMRVADLVRADEREACAKLCEAADIGYKEAHFDMADYLANAIRARGEK